MGFATINVAAKRRELEVIRVKEALTYLENLCRIQKLFSGHTRHPWNLVCTCILSFMVDARGLPETHSKQGDSNICLIIFNFPISEFFRCFTSWQWHIMNGCLLSGFVDLRSDKKKPDESIVLFTIAPQRPMCTCSLLVITLFDCIRFDWGRCCQPGQP